MEFYFEEGSNYSKFVAGTEFDFSFDIIDGAGNKYSFDVPRAKFETGEVVAGGKNTDVMFKAKWRGLYDGDADRVIRLRADPAGRGELHLAILIETMRREGYEFMVSRPEVILREAEDGTLLEPFEEVHIETSPETVGVVVEMLGSRRGQMMDLHNSNENTVHLEFLVPTRGLQGFRCQFLTATRGAGVMHTLFHDSPADGRLDSRALQRLAGMLGKWCDDHLRAEKRQERGIQFVDPGVEVFDGMVVGEHQRPGDLSVNVCKKKHLTNMRAARGDMETRLTPPRRMSLDEAIEFLADDELLEVTPLNFRVRKRILDTHFPGA